MDRIDDGAPRVAGGASLILALLLLASPDSARGQDEARSTASVRLRIDNDLLALRGAGPPPDYDYTHGTHLNVAWPSAPERLARLLRADSRCSDVDSPRRACLLSGVALAQEIFTPRHDAPDPVPGDRPYGAWLYGSVQLRRLAATGLHALEVRAGPTGPAALGEQVQNGVHRLLGNHLETGWSRQLPARLAVSADYEATRLLARSGSTGPSRFFAGSVGATLGTGRRALRGGVTAHYGFGPTRAPAADVPLVARPGRLHVTAGYEHALVLSDAFIEGAGATPGAVRLPWVGELVAGVGWRGRRVAGEYRYASRGREYRAQPGRHAHGSISLSVLVR